MILPPEQPMHFRGGPDSWDAIISVVYAARVWASEQGDQKLVAQYLELEEILVRLRMLDDVLS